MFQSWVDKRFNEFSASPVSLDSFKTISEEINNYFEEIHTDKLFNCDDSSSSSYCGISFKMDQLLYHCSDCALDETCVLCDKCFNYDVHKDHNFWYTIGSNSSGSCDCGEDDSWKNDLKCPHHSFKKSYTAVQTEINASDQRSLKTILDPVLSSILKNLHNYSLKNIHNGDSVLILYNDEGHSFEDVIEVLCGELEFSVSDAEGYAHLIDTKGFAPIYSSSIGTCQRLSRKFQTLTTSVESVETCFSMLLSTELIAFLSTKANTSILLRTYFVEWFLEEFSLESSTNNLAEILLIDHLLWKNIRACFSEILNLCNAINQESKKLIATTFCTHYNAIFDSYYKEKREPHLSVTNFSVQIFTLIPVAEHCIQNTDIMFHLVNKMVELLEPGYSTASGIRFETIRGFNYQKFSVLTHDALHISRNVHSGSLKIPNFMKTLDTFMYLLSLLTHSHGHIFKSGDHVTYDRDNNDSVNYICFELQQITQEFSRILLVNQYDFAAIWALFEKYVDQSPTFLKFLDTSAVQSPLYKSKRKASFIGSLSWMFSCFVLESLKHKNILDLKIPSKLVKCFSLDSLSRIIFSSEVRCGLWVRNGMIVAQQEFFYSGTVFQHLTYFSDLFNCIIASHLIERISYIEMLVKNYRIFDYLESQDQIGPVVEQFLIIFMNCCSITVPQFIIEQNLINTLCTEALTKSILVKILPENVSEDSRFRENITNMTTLNSVQSIGIDSKLEVKDSFMERFNPFYWAFSMTLRLKAWSNFKSKKRNHIELLFDLFQRQYTLPTEACKETDFLIELLSYFANSTSIDFEFSLEMLLITLKSVTLITSDQDSLKRISDCVSKLQSKKNVTEEILLFLNSFCPRALDDDKSSLVSNSCAKNKKSSIIASFKRQRNSFKTDIDVCLDDDEATCVVCSESGYKINGDFLGVPIQLNTLSFLQTRFSQESPWSCASQFKGCHHFVHKKCFDSLPSVGTFKKCSLCESAIDFVIPLAESFSSAVNHSVVSDLQSLEEFISTFCFTLLLQCHSFKDSFEKMPLNQILTLTNLKRFLCSSVPNFLKIDRSFLLSYSQFDTFSSVFKFNVYCLLGLMSGEIDKAEYTSFINDVLIRINNQNHAEILDCIGLTSNLFLNETFDRSTDLVVITNCNLESWESLKWNSSLFALPARHDLFLKEYLTKTCNNCGTKPRSSAVCLLCGTLVCVGQACCRQNHGECYSHRLKCSGSIGFFLMVRSCALLIVSESIGTIVPAPYVNSYGEHDFDLSSSSALFLNELLYYGKLGEMWKNGEFRDFILRNMDNSRMHANSWAML